jgi:hypothetical protein
MSNALVYYFEPGGRIPGRNDVYFKELIAHEKIPLGDYMALEELGKLLCLTKPKELLAVGAPLEGKLFCSQNY